MQATFVAPTDDRAPRAAKSIIENSVKFGITQGFKRWLSRDIVRQANDGGDLGLAS